MQTGVLQHELAARPAAADFTIIEAPVPACPADGLLIRTAYISLDPFVGARLRGRHMGEPAPTPLRDPVPAYAVGQVTQSRSPGFREGDWVHTRAGGWAELSAVRADTAHLIDISRASPALYLSALGMPGLTAWAGVVHRAAVTSGETFTVDAAAGAVGGCAGQLARIAGAGRVVGIAGGAGKCSLVEGQYGFDACIDYKADGWEAALAAALPEGSDVHFENVGIGLLNLSLAHLKPYGRAVICGLVDQYHAGPAPAGISPGLVIAKRASLMGLVVYDFFEHWPRYVEQALDWISNGELSIAHDCSEGLASAPAQFERLMEGHNIGKSLVKLDRDAP